MGSRNNECGYDDVVTGADVAAWDAEFGRVLQRLQPLFHRAEPRAHAEQYLRGLLAQLPRKNGWTISEYVGAKEPKALQRFLNLTRWDATELLAINRGYLLENLADPEAVLVADPTGFAKKGRQSVGVQRQYSGTLGRIDNCQIATFLAYVTPDRSRALLDRRLYLPEESWIGDRDRCRAAGVPDQIAFQTRPAQVIDMLSDAIDAGVPFAWFTADEESAKTRDYANSATPAESPT
ncbi:MAG: IS701 family transposase [Micropruina sp.]